MHKSVMFAYSLYCRTLFTGAFPSKTKEGLTLIDLSSFSEEVVRVFLDIIYGMKGEEVVSIEVEELLKLTDFLQADSDIPVITETLRMMLEIDNCLEIHNLAGAYNFNKLQTVTLTFISGNLQKLMKTDSWKKMDRETLFSLLKEPMIQCKPETSVGEAWKFCFSDRSDGDILMGVDFKNEYMRRTSMRYLHEDSSVIAVQRRVIDKEVPKSYFVFGMELFYIMTFQNKLVVSKYDQRVKMFIPNLQKPVINSIGDCSKMTVAGILVNEENGEDLTLVYVPKKAQYSDANTFSLVKVSLTAETDKVIQINTSFNVHASKIVGSPKGRKIYFCGRQYLHIYDIAMRAFTTQIPILPTIHVGGIKHFFEFKQSLYVRTHDKAHLRLHSLEKASSWKLCFEKELKMNVLRLKSCSSSKECAIILESKDDSSDHIYKMDFDPMEIRHFKTSKKLSEYLFVPEHICL